MSWVTLTDLVGQEVTVREVMIESFGSDGGGGFTVTLRGGGMIYVDHAVCQRLEEHLRRQGHSFNRLPATPEAPAVVTAPRAWRGGDD